MFRQRLSVCLAAFCFFHSTLSFAQAAVDEAPKKAPTEVLDAVEAPASAPAIEKTEAISKTMPEFRFQYRFGLDYNDDGFKKDANADEPFSSLGVNVFRILMDGKISSNLIYSLRLKFEGSDPRNLDYGYVKWNLTDNHSLSFGKVKIRDYGWEHRISSSAFTLAQSRGHEIRPFKNEDAVSFEGKYGWGAVTLQAVKDSAPACATATPAACQSWNKLNTKGEVIQGQPALFFEYVGDFAGVKPLVQYGSYDQNHSNIASLGVRYEAKGLDVYLDYTSHNIGLKGVKAGGTKFENLVSTETNIALDATYKINAWKPFLHYSVFDVDQYRNPGAAETKVNSAIGKFDDNATVIGLGTEYYLVGDAFRPFIGLVQKSGKYLDKNGKEATMAENELKVGVKGQF